VNQAFSVFALVLPTMFGTGGDEVSSAYVVPIVCN